LKTYPQRLSEILSKIGVESKPKDIGTDEIEKGDYYSRYFAQTPRMVTNKGCLEIKKMNIDAVQIIQKG
jgi:hypothetical protein